ncbi:hypothetical protein [Thioalbus denitrificans]|nr:hypothetical protein [Thioalbus denitrificans]
MLVTTVHGSGGRAMGLESVAGLGPWDLIPLTPAAAAILGD